MKKNYLLLFAILIFVSCVQQNDELITKNEKPKNTRFQELDYTTGNGTMGDPETGILGYGYDITGFVDSTSVKAKVVGYFERIHKAYPSSSERGMSNVGHSYNDFILKFNNLDDAHTITQKFNFASMFKQAYLNEEIDLNSIIVYNSSITTQLHMAIRLFSNIVTTESFQKDVIELDASKIVEKYGTHIILDYLCGQRYEFLYIIGTDKYNHNINIDKYISFKVNDLRNAKSTALDIKTGYEHAKEFYVFNYSGTKQKSFGMVTMGEENSSEIKTYFEGINYSNNNNISKINKLEPIYSFIDDENKKLEVKKYIEEYMQMAVDFVKK
jgi:hypothetical protein